LPYDTLAVLVTEIDLTPPSVPQSLQAQLAPGPRIDLTWDASTDNVAVAGYVIYRDGVPRWRTNATSFSDTELERPAVYEYTVEAYDPAGNLSGQSAPASSCTGLQWRTVSTFDE
jgi:hypothetical protein